VSEPAEFDPDPDAQRVKELIMCELAMLSPDEARRVVERVRDQFSPPDDASGSG
jgi:hypothetical protein